MIGACGLPQSCCLMLCVAAAVSMLLAAANSDWPFLPWDDAACGATRPSWLPWSVLGSLGLAAVVAAVLYPLPFEAALG